MLVSHGVCTIWFTGLSGAGKLMILDELVPQLKARGCKIEILDEEVVRAETTGDFVLSHLDHKSNLQRPVITCRQLKRGNAFIVMSGAGDESPDEAAVVCDVDGESPRDCAQKLLHKLEQLGAWALFGNPNHHAPPAYSGDEEALVTQRFRELGYM